MAKKRNKQWKGHNDFVKYSKKQGAIISNGGRHTKVSTRKGSTFLPRHGNRDLATGTRFAIIKQLAKLGILLMFFMCFGLFFIGQMM